ncbi:hypothetical protein CYMTET_57028 [Cymbomonas tetramitiformis]|uniref:Alpha-type protein kinase domain-containing protein n=1 Tax=Cymbomonas tetramitiformis TaxID=36881 RepID=A0AAE0ELD0_9CHLO|nr:hypothetical protein CYMTET_57028 [Cymbomonas tetramitiformis]|eukprot:gene14444-17074_t
MESLLDGFRGLALERKTRPEWDDSLQTSEHTLISHTHGRERRAERSIEKKELQEAIKYGRKEHANPGRNGDSRWKYTHRGVVYITDSTSRHEITCWRLDDTEVPTVQAANSTYGAHVVFVVDNSGSMRKNDVPGYDTRTAAVYDCLARDLVQPQLKGTIPGDVHVSLITMEDKAKVVMEKVAVNEQLLKFLAKQSSKRARSHGNYLPSLDVLTELFIRHDSFNEKQLFVIFLSDGAPSDHIHLTCPHGVQVWQADPHQPVSAGGKAQLRQCVGRAACRQLLKASVQRECLQRLSRLGDLLGRDRLRFHTVAFGSPDENYETLKLMATHLPRGSFQKLGLSAGSLKTALTSLTSTLTSMRTEAASKMLTLRNEKQQVATGRDLAQYDIYTGPHFYSKRRWDLQQEKFIKVPLGEGVVGVATGDYTFAEGGERYVYYCTELNSSAEAVGSKLIAKESKYEEHLRHTVKENGSIVEDLKDHDSAFSYYARFCRVLAEAQSLAELFNRRLNSPRPEWSLHFLDTVLYTVWDDSGRYPSALAYFTAELELEGKFTKWNNNGGNVRRSQPASSPAPPNKDKPAFSLSAITEDEEGSDEANTVGADAIQVEDVPQAFSHFTHSVTNGKRLVCDVQGVWNSVDGFMLTDPVIHYRSAQPGTSRRKYGATDKGLQGMRLFFSTHKCNAMCRRLGLELPTDMM